MEVHTVIWPLRWIPVLLGYIALGALCFTMNARAEEGDTTRQAPRTWVYDVRVVRVDPAEPAAMEAGPTLTTAGPIGATTTSNWVDLLAALRGRGRATILLDQRLTALQGLRTAFKHERQRTVLSLHNRSANSESWSASYVVTGTKGELMASSDSLEYSIDVSLEENPKEDGPGVLASVSWKGSCTSFATGETLVLSQRHQQVASPLGLEIYVFLTAVLLPPKAK